VINIYSIHDARSEKHQDIEYRQVFLPQPLLLQRNRSRSSMVGIVTRLRARPFGVGIPMGLRDFSLLERYRPAVGPTDPPMQWVPGYIFGVKVAGV